MKRNTKSYVLKTYNLASLEKEIPDYNKVLEKISKDAGSDPSGGILERWLELSDTISLVYVDGEYVGFSTAGQISPDKNLIYVASTMISEKYQNKGFASKLWMSSFKGALKLNINSLFKPVYFIFRTQNPKLYSILQRKTEIYPNFQNKQLKSSEKNMVIKASNFIWPNKELNVSEMILIDSCSEYPWLLPEISQINWSGNKQIDDFFESNLKLTKKGLDDFVVLGKIKFGFMLYFAR